MGLATTAIAAEPQAWEMTAADVVNAAKTTAHLAGWKGLQID